MDRQRELWQVQVTASSSDYAHLLKHFSGPPLRFVEGDLPGQLEFVSDSFQACTRPDEVARKATEELLVISGVLRHAAKSPSPLKVGAVYKRNDGGGRDIFITITETLELRAELGEVTVTIADSTGAVILKEPQPPRTVVLAKLAMNDPNVAKAMRLITFPDYRTWVGLYRLHEVIEADMGGMKALAAIGWGSPADLKRFKHSANSVAVGGDTSRHGKEPTDPPSHPMSLEEAEGYIQYILEAWLAEKCRAAT